MSQVEHITDPDTGNHIGTIVWPFGRHRHYYLFDPGNEREGLKRVPCEREIVAAALGITDQRTGILHRIKRWFALGRCTP